MGYKSKTMFGRNDIRFGRFRFAKAGIVDRLKATVNNHFIFFSDFSSSIDAMFAKGSRIGSFTASRSSTSPATYHDDNQTLSVVSSSNTPRFTYGLYDSTGFVNIRGVIIEGASTNAVPQSSAFDDATWTNTNITVTPNTGDITAPDGTSTVDILTATAGNGTTLLASAVTARTFSVFLRRKTGTGNIDITANGGTSWSTVTLTTAWRRFQVTVTSASQTCGIRIVTSGDAVYAWGAQFEDIGFATSYIPTVGSALTRNAENLLYSISNNRSAGTESFFMNMALFCGTPIVGSEQVFLTTQTKQRTFSRTSTYIRYQPNSDTGTAYAPANDLDITMSMNSLFRSSGSCLVNTAVVRLYTEGTSLGTTPGSSFSANTYGTFLLIGKSTASTLYMYGIVNKLAFYSAFLTSGNNSQMTRVNSIMT